MATIYCRPHRKCLTSRSTTSRRRRRATRYASRRIFWLSGTGMFFDGYDLYVGTSVLGATLAGGFSTLAQNAQFVSFTFIGMTIGALVAGFLGDAYGRRFTYQFNLLLFG